MKKVVPDNVVFTDDKGYNASLLSYPTNVGAPVIHIDNLVSWKSRGIDNVNKELGPEMKSTGESILFIEDLHDEAFLKLYSERNLYLSR